MPPNSREIVRKRRRECEGSENVALFIQSTPELLDLAPARAAKRPGSATQLPSTSVNEGAMSPLLPSSRNRCEGVVIKRERDRKFDAVGSGEGYSEEAKVIAPADDLNAVQLYKFLVILHACGKATDSNASLKSTRQSIDCFLEAVFKDWASDSVTGQLKPEVDMCVAKSTVAGMICGQHRIIVSTTRLTGVVSAEAHANVENCSASGRCTVDDSACATFSTAPLTWTVEFTMVGPLPPSARL